MADANVQDLVQKVRSNGHIFSVRFIKRTDKTERQMVCRFGVSRDIRGVGHSFDPEKKGLVCVWDMSKRDYRMIPVDAVKEMRVDGVTYKFD